MTPPRDRIDTALATMLRDTAHEVERLGASLCCDSHVAEAHINQLQGLDRIAQLLGGLAATIEAPDPVLCAQSNGFDELGERLSALLVADP
jgi:hypothetical protein